jgi:hypothetical protein
VSKTRLERDETVDKYQALSEKMKDMIYQQASMYKEKTLKDLCPVIEQHRTSVD